MPAVKAGPASVQARDITHLSPRGHIPHLTPSLGELGLGLLPSTEGKARALPAHVVTSTGALETSPCTTRTRPMAVTIGYMRVGV